MAIVTTSFTVSFSTREEGMLLAEVDDREDGLNAGKTSFRPGETVGFLIFFGPGVSLVSPGIYPSLGKASKAGNSEKIIEETLTFTKPGELEQTLRYPIAGNFTEVNWLGNALGSWTLDGQTVRVKPPEPTGYGAGVLKVKYTSPCVQYELSHGALEFPEYEIHTLVVGQFG